MSIEYAIIVKNKTRLEALTERFNTKSQANFYIESLGGNFEDYEAEHEVFQDALNALQTQLSRIVKNKTVERMYVPSFIFSEKNLVIVIGQDGLVANTAKYTKTVPIVAVNPDRKRYDGVLLPFDLSNFMEGVEGVLVDKYQSKKMNFAEAKLNDGQRLLAFNDLFVGAASHTSARYKISFDDTTEEQSSSGLIISTVAGSTGWLSSVFNMAQGITSMFQGSEKIGKTSSSILKTISKTSIREKPQVQQITLNDNELFFAVREPFKSIRTQTDMTVGVIKKPQNLVIESYMPTNGIIFSDGIESDFLRFNSGAIATIGIADETANIVMNPSVSQQNQGRNQVQSQKGGKGRNHQ